jgi:hypothetical protein
MPPSPLPRRRPINLVHADDRQVRFARALIGFNESFLKFTDAITGAHPGTAPVLPIEAAAQDLDDALCELQLAWAAYRAPEHGTVNPATLN